MLTQNHFVPLFRLSRWLLVIGFTLLWALLVLMAWKAPHLLPFVPLVLAAGIGGWYLFQHPKVNLVALLIFFASISSKEDGFQLTEVAFGAWFGATMLHWWIQEKYLKRRTLIRDTSDRLMLLWMCWIGCTVVISLIYKADIKGMISELIALSMLGFYFLSKDAIVQDKKGAERLIWILIWFGLFAAIRNILNYREIIANAQFEWQLERGRVITNEQFLLIPSLICLVLLMYATQWRTRIVLIAGFLLFLGSLIFTQSRGYWVDFAVGIFVLFFLLDTKRKIQLSTLTVISFFLFLGFAYILLGEHFFTIANGLMKRFMSLGTATSSDISLVNRFYESQAVWEMIKQNPIVGHGVGVSYSVYDLTTNSTQVKTFLHNGFLDLWFKFGAIGLVLGISVWIRSIWQGISIWRNQSTKSRYIVYIMMLSICQIALIPSANTSNPFYVKDMLLTFGLVVGIIAGLSERIRMENQ